MDPENGAEAKNTPAEDLRVKNASRMARRAGRLAFFAGLQSRFLRFLKIIFFLYIVTAGLLVGVLSLFLSGQAGSITVASLGFSIAGVKSVVSLLNLEARAVKLKDAQIQLRRLKVELKILRHIDPESEAEEGNSTLIRRKFYEYAGRLDELEAAVFAAGSFPRVVGLNGVESNE